MKSIRSVVNSKLQPDPVSSLRALAASVGREGPVSLIELLGVLAAPVKFGTVITTPPGTALGGRLDLELFSDGRFTFKVHLHDSGFDPYTFRVRCAARAPNGLTLLFQASGHTDGTGSNLFGSVNRNFDHSEEAHNPMIQAFWLDVRQASISVSKSYDDDGLLSTIEDLAKGLLGFLVAEVTLGVGLALVIAASAELSNAADANFVGPGGLVGVAVAGGVVWVFGPSAIIAAVAAGFTAGAITDAMIVHRELNDEEYGLARVVFGDTLPPQDRIYVTNLSHGGGRKYTWPNVDHSVLLNMGSALEDPVGLARHVEPGYLAPGQVFIHEMAHAWQIQCRSFVPGVLCKSVFGTGSYTPSIGTPWNDLGLEQQASTVDQWFGRHAGNWQSLDQLRFNLQSAAATQDPSFAYIVNHIRLGLN